jgi:hypothetical protein
VLAHGVRERCGTWWTLHGAGDVAGQWEFLKSWTKVWSCKRHADELVGAKRITARTA